MTSMVYGQASDVAAIWPAYTSADEDRVNGLLAKASARLRQACPFNIDDRIDLFETDPTNPQALDPLVVVDVVANIVKRALTNPNGVVSESQAAGPFSEAHTFASRNGQVGDGLSVTAADVDALRPAQPAVLASTIRIKPGRMVHGFADGDPWIHRRWRG